MPPEVNARLMLRNFPEIKKSERPTSYLTLSSVTLSVVNSRTTLLSLFLTGKNGVNMPPRLAFMEPFTSHWRRSRCMERYFENVEILLTKTDGTVIDMSNSGGSIKPEHGVTVCGKGEVFDEIIPLEELESISVGGIEYQIK